MPSQEEPNAVLPTTISIYVQKLAILAYFEASSWRGGGGALNAVRINIFDVLCMYSCLNT